MSGDGRIDPAGQQAHDAAGRSGRQASCSSLFAEKVERPISEQLDVDDQLRIVEVYRPAARLLDAATDLALDLRRCQRKALVGATGRDAKAGARAIAQLVENRRGDRVEVSRNVRPTVLERRMSRVRKIGDAEHAR